MVEPAVQPAAVRAARARADVGAQPGAGRRQPGHGLRQVAGQAGQQGPAEGHVRRRRRPRRGGRGARGDQGVPRVAGQVPGDGREDPEGRAALRAARHRQDAARQGGRRRGRRAVLLDQRLGLRRDVRRRRRVAGARPLRAGEGRGARDRVRRRDRRRRPSPRCRRRRWSRRARADAEPAARRDGRVRPDAGRDPARVDEPSRHPRPRAAAPGSLRPPDRRRPSRPRGPQGDPRGARARRSRSRRASTST